MNNRAAEYIDCLTSLELCAKLAGDNLNTKLKACCSTLLGRIHDRQVYLIVEGLRRQPFPAGALAMMRRQLDALNSK